MINKGTVNYNYPKKQADNVNLQQPEETWTDNTGSERFFTVYPISIPTITQKDSTEHWIIMWLDHILVVTRADKETHRKRHLQYLKNFKKPDTDWAKKSNSFPNKQTGWGTK